MIIFIALLFLFFLAVLNVRGVFVTATSLIVEREHLLLYSAGLVCTALLFICVVAIA